VALLLVQFLHRFVGQPLIGPDLPMGCGLLAPIIAPRFSKISTWLTPTRAPSSAHWSVQVSTTRLTSICSICPKVRSCRGEKQTMPQIPRSLSASSSSCCSSWSGGVSGFSAAKSLS
jgi:hypothetical protein